MKELSGKAERIYWAARKIFIGCPSAAHTMLAVANNKRRWLLLCNPATSPSDILIIPSLSEASVVNRDCVWVYLTPGSHVIFSLSGDMPWQGPVYGYPISSGITVDVYGGEVSDYP